MAMILREHLGAGSEQLFSVVGVDIDSEVIATARTGIYERNSFRAMDSTLRDRYFYPCGPNRYQIGEIKQQVTLAVANLLAEPYPPVLHQPDIIFYRNVSIYFPRRIQEAIFRQLAALLREDGYLFVGAAETMHHNLGVLNLIERNGLFFYHKPPQARSSACCPRERRSLVRQGPAGGIPALFRKPLAAKGSGHSLRTIPTEARREPALRARPLRKIDVQGLIGQAHSLAQNSNFDAALQLLDQIVIDHPALIEALVLKGSILMSTARFEEAKALCRMALELQPLCGEAILILGLIAQQDGEEDEARQRLRQTIYLQQASWLAHFSLAEMNFRQADQHRARHGYETALRILQQETAAERDRVLFPLAYNAGDFMAICRHKLSLL
jgi:chemotaxis protein methyltransferase CheR